MEIQVFIKMNINNKKIFFVEDDKVLLELFKSFLESKGASVTHFYSSKNAYEEIKKFNDNNLPNLFIFDYSMPYISGVELYQEVRNKNKNVPIFMISGYHPQELIDIEDNSMTILSKPVHPKQLIIEINKLTSEA